MSPAIPALLEDALYEGRRAAQGGKVATYIPALASADPAWVGIALTGEDGVTNSAGDARQLFSIQSVSKILSLALVLEACGHEAVFSRVGKEPSGDPFNSIIRLETSRLGKPFNPLINAGAIVVSGMVPGDSPLERQKNLLSFTSRLAGRADVEILEEVYRSERDTANRNRSIAWFLKELGLIDGDVEEALDSYFRQCAIALSAFDLSRIGAVLGADGRSPWTEERILSRETARTVKALMMSCGLYDGSGEFAVNAGIPAKSGVGGGIIAAAKPGLGIGSFGPALDGRGNSASGVRMLSFISDKLDLYAL